MMSSRFRQRHFVLSILFVTWIVSFIDRIAISVAMPTIANEFHLTPLQSGFLMSAFFASYALAQIPGGLLADRYGVRRVATIALAWWSVFTAATGAAGSFLQMLMVRFVFGLGEGVFPACAYKTVAVWFPKRERATANAIMLASNPLGAALSPLFVVGVMSIWGWRGVFYSLLVPGIVMALLFWRFVPDRVGEPVDDRQVALASQSAATPVGQEEPTAMSRLKDAFRQPNVVQYFLILFSFDIAYWGFTTWLPSFLMQARGFSLVQMGVAASLPFFAGTVGCVLGGWLSDRFFAARRRLPMVTSQVASALLLYLMFHAETSTALVIYQTIAGFFLSYFISAFWALPMNSVSQSYMGVVSGFINMAGQLAAFATPILVGYLLGSGGGYGVVFSIFIGSVLVSCLLTVTLPTHQPTLA
jgi:sugar phosphate permease